MPNLWTPEAETLKAAGTSGTLTGVGGAKCIVHVTVSPSGGSWFDQMHRVLIGKEAEPHYLYDPVTDRLGQYFPLDRSSRSLKTGAGPVSCNKNGKRVIQIEIVADVGPVFTSYWRPGKNFRAMMRDIAAHGVPARFPYRLATSYADAANVRVTDYSAYRDAAGFLGHCNVPGQNTPPKESAKLGHFDPGPISTPDFLSTAYPPTLGAPVMAEPFSLSSKFTFQSASLSVLQGLARGAYAYGLLTGAASIPVRLAQQEARIKALEAAVAANKSSG